MHLFMNTPQGEGPFPMALVMHGYIPPENYQTIAYTTRYADALAQAGYLVIHPNYRNYPPSAEGPDLFRKKVDAWEDNVRLFVLTVEDLLFHRSRRGGGR